MNVPEDLKEILTEKAAPMNCETTKYISLSEVIEILEGYELPKCKDTSSESLLEN